MICYFSVSIIWTEKGFDFKIFSEVSTGDFVTHSSVSRIGVFLADNVV